MTPDAGDRLVDAADRVNADVAAPCTTDRECDDHLFCNGVERCAPATTGANLRGCAPAAPSTPCLPNQTCNEAAMRCESPCGTARDADHDGHESTACGGDDCDDTDPNRYPGNPEVCVWSVDARVDPTHDEDCDPTTVSNSATHDGDRDADGYVDVACCNVAPSGSLHCGDDCHDTSGDVGFRGTPYEARVPADQIHPTQSEVCNGVDDNCVSGTDEGLMQSFYSDCDGDGFGDSHGTVVEACSAREVAMCGGHDAVANGTDCNDTAASTNPGLAEICDAVDNDCDGLTDNRAGYACVFGSTRNDNVCGRDCTYDCDNTCTWSPRCTPADTRWVWNGNDAALGHQRGYSCYGTYWCVLAPDAGTDAQYGPYASLPPGTYSVTWDFDVGTGGVTTFFDVYAGSAGGVLAMTATGHLSGPQSLTFTVPAGCSPTIEFRVHFISSTAGQNLVIRSTTVNWVPAP